MVPSWSSVSAALSAMVTSSDPAEEMENFWEFSSWGMEVLEANVLEDQRSLSKTKESISWATVCTSREPLWDLLELTCSNCHFCLDFYQNKIL